MPNTWMNQSTLGDIKPDVREQIPTSSTRQEIRTNTKLLLKKQKNFVLVKLEKTTAQSKQNVCGTQSLETNLTEYGEASLIVRETP